MLRHQLCTCLSDRDRHFPQVHLCNGVSFRPFEFRVVLATVVRGTLVTSVFEDTT